MMWIFLIFILLQVILYPCIIFTIGARLYRKEYTQLKRPFIGLCLLILFSGFTFELIPGSKYFWAPFDALHSLSYTDDLFGKSFVMGEPVQKDYSKRSFQGDGASVEVYRLNPKLIEYFNNPDSAFFTKYPESSLREDWESSSWKKTPILDIDKKAFGFASYATDSISIDLEEILNEKGSYYAYQCNLHNGSLERDPQFGNIDFYIISLERKVCVLINVNT